MENKLKVVVFSLGCKVNQYEGRSMVEKLEENGFRYGVIAAEEAAWIKSQEMTKK